MRHLKQRESIDPLAIGPVIPKLPEKAADVSGGEKDDSASEIPFSPFTQDRGATQPVIDRIQQEKEA